MKSSFFPTLALTLALAGAPALAKEAIFVSPEQSEAIFLLPNPPVEGSDEQKAELQFLHAIETARTPAQAEAAKADADNQTIFIYKSVFGDIFTEANLPLTAALGQRIHNDEGLNADAAKAFFHRVHPYTVDKTLNPVCPTKAKDDSYPSGHTTVGWLLGLSLAEMVPEKRDAILTRATEYGRNRLICGVHYPSDVLAGRNFAYAVHGAMAQSPQYKQELAAARAELRKALGLPEFQAPQPVKADNMKADGMKAESK